MYKLGDDEWFIGLTPGSSFDAGSGIDNVYSLPSALITPGTDPSIWGNIWQGAKDLVVPLSTAAANIIRATTGQPITSPTGYTRNAMGQLVPIAAPQQSWLIPALLIGGVGIYMLSKKR